MSHQRDRLLGALGRIVAQVDNLTDLVPFVRQLGADHRKFGVEALHYPEVGQSLVATLRYLSGAAWNDTLAKDWTDAYTLVAKVMVEAADEDAAHRPAWWNAHVVAHERRRFDLAVLRVVTDRPLPYQPRQSVALEAPARPRVWRYYSMANAPLPGQHARLPRTPGGRRPGESRPRARPPLGGLAQARAAGRHDDLRRAVRARRAPDRREHGPGAPQGGPGADRAEPRAAAGAPVPRRADRRRAVRPGRPEQASGREPLARRRAAVSDEQAEKGAEQGVLADVVARHGLWRDHDAYVCGSPAMVDATVDRLVGLGTDRIRADKLADA